jgi:hypothetical protein
MVLEAPAWMEEKGHGVRQRDHFISARGGGGRVNGVAPRGRRGPKEIEREREGVPPRPAGGAMPRAGPNRGGGGRLTSGALT